MSKYHEDPYVRKAIDILLRRNRKRESNLGVENDIQMQIQKEIAKEEWKEDCEIIGVLDPEFWVLIEPQND